MIRPDSPSDRLVLASPARAPSRPAEDARPRLVSVTVKAGPYDRDRDPDPVRGRRGPPRPGRPQGPRAGPVALLVRSIAEQKPAAFAIGAPAQADRSRESGRVRVTFVLPRSRPAEGGRRFTLRIGDAVTSRTRPRPRLVASPRASPAPSTSSSATARSSATTPRRCRARITGRSRIRDAYIHPAYSPSGALITGDFSPSHPHHRGFFLAYERTKTGDLTPDFWNIHVGTGKIHADGFDKPVVGPVTARFSARHRWEAKDKATGTSTVVLRERWDVEAYDIPGAPYWLFDITSTQQAVDRPLEVLPYRYGGMAYRGPEPFVKGTLDVLTSEGQHRKDGDQKPARWVNLTGPVADGSDQYAGAMIADHPSNPHYPDRRPDPPDDPAVLLLRPRLRPAVTIAVDAPTVFRYRVLIHDGRPDAALDERVARDFAEPPTVVVE